jgi:general secretion pathway protein I
LNGHPEPPPARRRGRGRRRRGSAGFTLLEVLVAVVILALSLSALMSAFGTGVRGLSTIDNHLRARLLAQSLLAEWSQHRALRPGQIRGSSDRFAWAISVTPLDEISGAALSRGDQWKLHELKVAVSWSPGRQVELSTLRILRAQ